MQLHGFTTKIVEVSHVQNWVQESFSLLNLLYLKYKLQETYVVSISFRIHIYSSFNRYLLYLHQWSKIKPHNEGDLLGHAADVAVAAVDGAVARGRVQRRLRRALRRISQEVGVGLFGVFWDG